MVKRIALGIVLLSLLVSSVLAFGCKPKDDKPVDLKKNPTEAKGE